MSKQFVARFDGEPPSDKVQASYLEKLNPLANKWNSNIVTYICHNSRGSIPNDLAFDNMYIFIQLLPEDFKGISMKSIESVMLDGKEVVFPKKISSNETKESWPQGDILVYDKKNAKSIEITDDNDIVLAVIDNFNLYFTTDFIHCRSSKELESSHVIFDYVMNKAINEYKLIDMIKSGVVEKSKASLEKALNKMYKDRLKKETTAAKAVDDTVVEYQKAITEAIRRKSFSEAVMKTLESNIADVSAATDKTWNSIIKMSSSHMYNRIDYTSNSIIGYTNDISIPYKGNEYDMGSFKVTLTFDGTCRIDSLRAKEQKEKGLTDHPHVSSGNPCWGNLSGTLPKYIGSGELDIALLTVHTFLGAYDENNPYKKIENWPKVNTENKPKKVVKK